MSLDHHDLALQNIQTIMDEATETMRQYRALQVPNSITLNDLKENLVRQEDALYSSYTLTHRLLSEGRASQIDVTNLQQLLHQLATIRYQINHSS